ncbi:hypothetical protein ACH49_25030 [Streptomyces leeuwenhoekii]|uniref:Uncharacterized protein n=1 Tax=Streptomyces leeuwenhoekii TaxID=1437453 RepID=A0ABR5HTD6_STRLW|nr:hypothetical protein [Streptomyces leeuwenhoekii]KMS71156.1 hypothetical protein ACH49_25030 [Streptomyces leeuwenhoekii]
MPRPNAAQLACGSCTVVFSTLAMLLLSRTGSDGTDASVAAIAVTAVVALGLGVLVALTVPLPRTRGNAAARPRRPAGGAGRADRPGPPRGGRAGAGARGLLTVSAC